MAGQVESRIVTAPVETASRNLGAWPYSSSVTADVSIAPTQPAPMSMSAWNPACGTPIRWRS